MTVRSACPRCARVVARRSNGGWHDHYDPETGEWCSQVPKSIHELMFDLLASTRLERQHLAALTDVYLELGDAIVEKTKLHTEQMGKSTELIKRVTEELTRQLAEKQAEQSR